MPPFHFVISLYPFIIQSVIFNNAMIERPNISHTSGCPMVISKKAKQINTIEYNIWNSCDKIDMFLLLLKQLTPQSISMIPVPMHKIVGMNCILNHIMPCTDHHKHEITDAIYFMAYLLLSGDS